MSNSNINKEFNTTQFDSKTLEKLFELKRVYKREKKGNREKSNSFSYRFVTKWKAILNVKKSSQNGALRLVVNKATGTMPPKKE